MCTVENERNEIAGLRGIPRFLSFEIKEQDSELIRVRRDGRAHHQHRQGAQRGGHGGRQSVQVTSNLD